MTYTGQTSKRLKDFLKEECGYSRRKITSLFHGKKIQINHKLTPLTYELKNGDVITIQEDKISVLYESDSILVVEKPSGICIHPTHEHPQDNLETLLEEEYAISLYPVTRLDKPVSGIVVFAKHHKAASDYNFQHRTKKMWKEYTAICEGTMKEKSGTLIFQLGKEKGKKGKQITASGKKCSMDYEVIHETGDTSVVKIHLNTGRTHQIRAGFAGIGHPLLGDSLYGGDYSKMKRVALHCSKLHFIEMDTKQEIEILSPLPEDMEECS